MRPRKLPDAIVEKDLENSQKNIAIMKKCLKDFVQVTNDDDLSSLRRKQTHCLVNLHMLYIFS